MKKIQIFCLAVVLLGINVAATAPEEKKEKSDLTCGPITILKIKPPICTYDPQPFTSNAGYSTYIWTLYNGSTPMSTFTTSTNTIYLDYLDLCGKTHISVQVACGSEYSNIITKPYSICWEVCNM